MNRGTHTHTHTHTHTPTHEVTEEVKSSLLPITTHFTFLFKQEESSTDECFRSQGRKAFEEGGCRTE